MILVTGDRGFIGSELKQYLTAQGHDVHGLDWDTRGNTYTARTPVEWIFHMGAISETNADNWADIVCKNIKDTQDWIQTAERWGCGITYASSASVYGHGVVVLNGVRYSRNITMLSANSPLTTGWRHDTSQCLCKACGSSMCTDATKGTKHSPVPYAHTCGRP